MPIRTELALRLPNSPGALAGVCRLLADDRVNLLALSLDTGGQLRLIVDNPVRAASVLREQHHQVAERNVLFTTVPNGPGALAPVLALVADAAINVEYAYASSAEGNRTAALVLGVDDAARAAAAAGV
ncbi:MAG: hypothetical protein A3H97_15200 [Acidobacteria bacterium RIFCSPLOWO2_02_FULL_65_29]|nr:MAG: hypothetical protein A3H97_15200 [Acidobacteria bacterium RIFCSPLOWO2_02_FULL_65_29]